MLNWGMIKGLVNTEKSTKMPEEKYLFKVDKSCTKPGITLFLKKVFSVDVMKVNIMNYKGKVKRFKGIKGQRKSRKLAIVTLNKGQKIDFQNLKIENGN